MLRALLLALLLAASAFAAPTHLDRLKVGSQMYTNVNIVSVSATDLYFSYEKGVKNVKLRQLDPETQKLFNYDAQAALQLESQQNQSDAKFQTTVASRPIAAAGTSGAAAASEKARTSSEENIVDSISEQSPIGKPGPAISVEKWSGSASAPILKGRFVLVTFWTPWSVPCQKWIPQFNELQKKFADKLAVIGFVPAADAEDRSMDSKVDFPFAVDEKGKYQAALGVKNVPCVALMDPAGTVLYLGHPAALGDKELALLLTKAAKDTR